MKIYNLQKGTSLLAQPQEPKLLQEDSIQPDDYQLEQAPPSLHVIDEEGNPVQITIQDVRELQVCNFSHLSLSQRVFRIQLLDDIKGKGKFWIL